MKTALKKKPIVTKKPEAANETPQTQGPLLNQPPAPAEGPTLAPFTVIGLRRVHDGVTWLYEACYLTVEGTKIVSVKNEAATSREIAEAKMARDLIGLQFNEKGPGFGRLPDNYFR